MDSHVVGGVNHWQAQHVVPLTNDNESPAHAAGCRWRRDDTHDPSTLELHGWKSYIKRHVFCVVCMFSFSFRVLILVIRVNMLGLLVLRLLLHSSCMRLMTPGFCERDALCSYDQAVRHPSP